MIDIKDRLGMALKSAVCTAVAASALLVALVFLCAAAFVMIEAERGVVVACVALASFFLGIAILALIVMGFMRSRARRRLEARRAAANAQWWLDPRVIAASLKVGSALGARRILPLALLGGFAAGLLLTRPSSDDQAS
jgi:hypothetical protein